MRCSFHFGAQPCVQDTNTVTHNERAEHIEDSSVQIMSYCVRCAMSQTHSVATEDGFSEFDYNFR